MEPTASWPLHSWEGFYVIVGTAVAALTGLQFVVIVLGAETGAVSRGTTRAFGTPTIVHFSAVLFISALLGAPWHGPMPAAIGLAACGLAGVIYSIMVFVRTRAQADYVPVLEDWLFHCAFPLLSYLALVIAAAFLPGSVDTPLFVVGAAAVALMFIGIHNAWDAVIYIALRERPHDSGATPEVTPRE